MASRGSAGWRAPRPAYFDAADRRLAIILEAGLVPCIVGAWGYHLDDAGTDVMTAHWRELVARYAAMPVVWVIAGEASLPWYDQLFLPETPTHAARLSAGWSVVARATRALDPWHRPLTVHPSPGVDATASLDVFADTTLTDYQMLQTGHWDRGSLPGTMDTLARIVAAVPDQPVLNGEVCYEGIMGASWPDIQRFLFWAEVLGGAAGHTYGAQGLWGMNDGSFTGQVGSLGRRHVAEASAAGGRGAHRGRAALARRAAVGRQAARERAHPSRGRAGRMAPTDRVGAGGRQPAGLLPERRAAGQRRRRPALLPRGDAAGVRAGGGGAAALHRPAHDGHAPGGAPRPRTRRARS